MLKNCVLKTSVNTQEWIKAAVVRAVKTFAETMLGFVVIGAGMSDIDWIRALSVSAVATIASVLWSVKGIPEVESEESK